jgi:hypothetical protein
MDRTRRFWGGDSFGAGGLEDEKACCGLRVATVRKVIDVYFTEMAKSRYYCNRTGSVIKTVGKIKRTEVSRLDLTSSETNW